MIKISNLTKVYKSKKTGDCTALNNISFTLPDTGMVFVIGKSGSGKSTLLNLMGGLDTITSGDIIADGIDLKKLKNKDFDKYRSSYLTFVFQDYKLFEGLTVLENVQVGLDITNSCDDKLVLDAIEKVGLKGYEDRFPFQLSGGEQQRVAIARSLVRDSKLILADEPTGNLDARTTKKILDLLKEVSKERLVVIVSHNLGDADIYADRIIELHNGCILSDKVKDSDYINEFKVVDNKAYLPHYFDLNDSNAEELCENIKSNNVNELIQIDNGFKEISNLNFEKRNIDLNPKKATNKSLLKLSKMFLKKKVSTRVLTIAFSIVIFVLLSVIQSFILFDLKPTEVVFDDDYIVMHKGATYPLETSMRTAKLHGIVDSDMDAFLATGYQGDYYMLSNYGPDYSYSIYNNSYGLHNSHESFYFNKLTGTLKCDYEFLVDLFGVDGELKVLAGDLYDKPYGIIITDYMADALINYRYAISYENLIGADQYTYINAIIDTNYEEEFKDLISFYATRPNYPDIDSFVKASYEQPDYEKYTQLISRYYSVGFTLNENFEKDLLESDFFNRYAYTGDFKFEDKEFVQGEYGSSAREIFSSEYGNYKNYDLKPGQIVLSLTVYNEIFGTTYTSSNFSLEANNKITLSMSNYVNGEEVIVYEKEFEIVSLGYTVLNAEDFREITAIQIADYGVYFENNSYANEIISVGNEHGFYLSNVDFGPGLMIVKLTSAFTTLFLIVLVIVYIVLFGYVIISGINVVKGNKAEIGIYKSLGGKFYNIGKVLLLDIIITGVLIIVISMIATPIILDVADDVLIRSFENVLNIKIFHLSIIKTFVSVLSINFAALFLAIILSAVIPALWLFTLKPIQIIKE